MSKLTPKQSARAAGIRATEREIRRLKASPCNRPPAAPTHIRVKYNAVENDTHKRFIAKIKWDEVETDTSGLSAKVERYEVRFVACDENGVPIEQDADPDHHSIVGAVAGPETGLITMSTVMDDLVQGDIVTITGMTPSGWNGDWRVTAIPADNQIRIDLRGSSPANGSSFGEVHEAKRIRERIFVKANPTRVAIRGASIVSGTTAEYVLGHVHNWEVGDVVVVRGVTPAQYNGILTITAVPASNVFRANIGTSPAAATKFGSVYEARDGHRHVITRFVPHPRRWHYKIKVRARSEKKCWGPWSPWTPPLVPYDTLRPAPPENVKIFPAHDRIHVHTRPPVMDIERQGTVSCTAAGNMLTGVGTHFGSELEAGIRFKVGTEIHRVKRVVSPTSLRITDTFTGSFTGVPYWLVERDPDAFEFRFQIAKASDVDTSTTPDDWSDVYDHVRTKKSHHSFKIDDDDEDLAFMARVQIIDREHIHSFWVPARKTANDDPDADGQSVRMLRDRVSKSFTIPNEVIAQDYPQVWRADRDYRFKRVTAEVGVGGEPSGQALKVNLRKLSADRSSDTAVLDTDDTISIPAGDFKDGAGGDPSDFNDIHIDNGEYLYVRVIQVGSGDPGSNLVVTAVLIPRDTT